MFETARWAKIAAADLGALFQIGRLLDTPSNLPRVDNGYTGCLEMARISSHNRHFGASRATRKGRRNTPVKQINWAEIGLKAQRRITLGRPLIQAFQFVALDYRKAVRRSDLSQHTMNVVFHRLFR